MDLIFEQFLKQQYADLDAEMQQTFEHLLDCSDLDILSWINELAQPDDKGFLTLVKYLQKYKTISENK